MVIGFRPPVFILTCNALWYTVVMDKSVTTSIRFPKGLRERVEREAHKMGRTKNWVIVRAVEDYLGTVDAEARCREARRQSIEASRQTAEESDWEEAADFRDWK